MKGINYKKLMDSKKIHAFEQKENIIANLTVSGMLLTSTVVVPASLLWAPTTVEAALVSAELSQISQRLITQNECVCTLCNAWCNEPSQFLDFWIKCSNG